MTCLSADIIACVFPFTTLNTAVYQCITMKICIVTVNDSMCQNFVTITHYFWLICSYMFIFFTEFQLPDFQPPITGYAKVHAHTNHWKGCMSKGAWVIKGCTSAYKYICAYRYLNLLNNSVNSISWLPIICCQQS